MRKETSNQFTEGLISDLTPITAPNTILTDALNGTIITYNGNEFSLQNDRGNYELENCKLKPNYIPVGIKEHGDILYIVSYNPLNKHVEIGSYPSPLQVNALDSDDFDAELKSIIQEYVLDAGKTEGNYSELITKEQQIVFNGEDFKLYPGDQYKLEDEPKHYKYETIDYFVMDDASILHNITDDIKKALDKKDFTHVSWLIPGWIVSKMRLAQLGASELNIRSFIASPSKDYPEKKNVTCNFNFKTNVDDPIVNSEITPNNNQELKFNVKVTSTKSEGNLNTNTTIDVKSITEWYLNNQIILANYTDKFGNRPKDDEITVSITPVLNDETGGYKIVYDNLTQSQTFDISKVNDIPFEILNTYKYYVEDGFQVFEFNVDGPKITTSQAMLYYDIYRYKGKGTTSIKSGIVESFEGIGTTRFTIPFDDSFKCEDVYRIKFEFKSIDTEDMSFPESNNEIVFIASKLLTRDSNLSTYESGVLEYVVKQYMDQIVVDWSNAVNKEEIASNLNVLDEDSHGTNYSHTKLFLKDSEFNTFVNEESIIYSRVPFTIEHAFMVYKNQIQITDPVDGDLWKNLYESNHYYDVTKIVEDLSYFKTKVNIEGSLSTTTLNDRVVFIDGEIIKMSDESFYESAKDSFNYKCPNYTLTINANRDRSDINWKFMGINVPENSLGTGTDLKNAIKIPFEKIYEDNTFTNIPYYFLTLDIGDNIICEPTAYINISKKEKYLLVFRNGAFVASNNMDYLTGLLNSYSVIPGNFNPNPCKVLYGNVSVKNPIIDRTFKTVLNIKEDWKNKWKDLFAEETTSYTHDSEIQLTIDIQSRVDEINDYITSARASKQLNAWKETDLYKEVNPEDGNKPVEQLKQLYWTGVKKDELTTLTYQLNNAVQKHYNNNIDFDLTSGIMTNECKVKINLNDPSYLLGYGFQKNNAT